MDFYRKNITSFKVGGIKDLAICFVSMLVSTIIIIVMHPQSLLSVITYLIILEIYNFIFTKEQMIRVFYWFQFLLMVSLIIYVLQYISWPLTIGLSPGQTIVGAGTDDVHFYGQSAVDFPNGFPFREPHIDSFVKLDSYSKVLRIFASFFHLFYANSPIDLLGFNVLMAALLPHYIRRILQHYTTNCKTIRMAIVLSMIDPYLVANGLILLRDGVIEVLFCIFLALLLENKVMKSAVPLLVIAFLRPGTFFLVCVSFASYYAINTMVRLFDYRVLLKRKSLVIALLLTAISLFVVFRLWDAIYEYYYLKFGDGGFFRTGLVQKIENKNQISGMSSEFYRFVKLPLLLRIPVLTMIIFVTPMFDLGHCIVNGTFVIRNVVLELFFPFVFSFTFPFFMKGIRKMWKEKNRLLPYAYIMTLILIAVVSLQSRHKTMLMPLYYAFSAIGYESTRKKGRLYAMGVSLMLLEVLYFCIS